MENRLIVAGFGGQGVMMLGQLMCYAAIENGKEALFLPHYGPEQRGGTANCTVTLSDQPIFSPIVKYIDVLIAMNQPSLVKFSPRICGGGVILANSDMCTGIPHSSDISYIEVPVDANAGKLGSAKVANIIMLAAYNHLTGLLTPEQLERVVLKKLAKKPELAAINKAALRVGRELMSQTRL
jgi:2-oxoglutarate ferredoxin oxidoreductase subunit gamma